MDPRGPFFLFRCAPVSLAGALVRLGAFRLDSLAAHLHRGANAEDRARDKNGPIFLRIKGVRLFPENPDAEVQVLAIVNGTTYQHPSVAGVKWMKVGPDMSEKLIELPAASRYDIRFEMKIRNGSSLQGQESKQLESSPALRATSQLATSIQQLPHKEDYKLYDVIRETRSAAVRAIVSFEVTQGS